MACSRFADRVVHILRQSGIEMDVIKKWLEMRRKDDPAWFKLVRELEENPDQPDLTWLEVIEMKYDGSLLDGWEEYSRRTVPIMD